MAAYQATSITPPAASTASLAHNGVAAGTAAANRPRKKAMPLGLVISVRKPTRMPCSSDGAPWPVPVPTGCRSSGTARHAWMPSQTK